MTTASLVVARLPAGNLSSGSTWASPPGVLPGEFRPKEILREHRTAREPRSHPPAVSLPRRHRPQRATATARELLSAQPLPADVTVTPAALGGVPTAEITVDRVEPRHVVLYFHGGVYVMGDAFLAATWPRRSAGGPAPRSSPSTTGSPRAPVSGSGRRRSGRLPSPPAQRHRPIGHRLRGRVRWRRARHRHSSQRARSRAAPAPQPLSCHRMPTSPWPGRPWKPSARPTR